MTHIEFFEQAKNNRLARCYLFEGTEEHIKQRALQVLLDSVGSGDMAVMNQSILQDPSPDLLIASCETLPLMTDRRLIVVRECTMLMPNAKPKDYNEDDAVKQLDAYFSRLSDGVCLVFYVRGKADGRRKFYQVLKKKAAIVAFDPLDDKQLNQWIKQEAERCGKTITPEICQYLWFTAGRTLTLLSCEINKLAAYIGDRNEITQQDIEDICVRSTEYKVFDLADTLLSGNGAKALKMERGLIEDGEESIYLLALLSHQCRSMRYAALLAKTGLREYDIAGRLGIPGFAVKKSLDCARRYTAAQMRDMVSLCLDTEFKVKSGEMNEAGALEMVMLHILSMREDNRHV